MDHPVLREELPLSVLEKNEHNPNKMTAKGFNLLVDNIARMGITDPILVVKRGDKYRIVGGHHRAEAAEFLGYTQVPCTIITDPNFDEDQENFQLMRHNMIKGKLDREGFVKLYEMVQERYTDEVLAEAFGFEDQTELKAMVKETAKSLPPEMRAKFKEAAKEVKTIKDLSGLLNRLFNSYGDTLPYGFMFMDFGGKDSVWVRMMQKDLNNVNDVFTILREEGKTLDGLLRAVLQSIAKNDNPELMKIFEKVPNVDLSEKPEARPLEHELSMLED